MDELQQQLDYLLAKYHSGQIPKEEFLELQMILKGTCDEELKKSIGKLWDDFKSDSALSDEKKEKMLACINTDINTTLKGDALLPEHKSYREIWWSTAITAAAAVVLLVISNVSVFLWTGNKYQENMAEQKIEFSAGESDKSMVTLPDGSTVRLNKGSRLIYANDFNDKTRTVELQGEGLFKVIKNKDKKFIVKTEYMDVSVLGTTFNVYAYPEDNHMETTLIEGKVQLTTHKPPYKSVILSPGEKVTYNKETDEMKHELMKHIVHPSWTRDNLVFKNTQMREVFARLEKIYGVTFTIKNSSLLNDQYTGKFDNDSLEDVLQILQWHFQFDYIIDNKLNEKHVIINN